MTVRELARALGCDSHAAWKMVAGLLDAGLLVKRDRPGGRKYVAVNRAFPAYTDLMALLAKIASHYPPPTTTVPGFRWGLQTDTSTFPSKRLDLIFASPVRSRVLLLIAASGSIVTSDVADLLGLDAVSAMYAVNHWERERVIRSRYIKRCRILSLDDRWFAATELRALLTTLTLHNSEYGGLGAIARQRHSLAVATGQRKNRKPEREAKIDAINPSMNGRTTHSDRRLKSRKTGKSV